MFSASPARAGEQGKGKFTREELAPLAKGKVESLKEFNYFTFATANGKKAAFADPQSGY